MSNEAAKRVMNWKREALVLHALRPLVSEATFFTLQMVIAHDGSLGAALSRATVARGEQIGLARLLKAQPKDAAQ